LLVELLVVLETVPLEVVDVAVVASSVCVLRV